MVLMSWRDQSSNKNAYWDTLSSKMFDWPLLTLTLDLLLLRYIVNKFTFHFIRVPRGFFKQFLDDVSDE